MIVDCRLGMTTRVACMIAAVGIGAAGGNAPVAATAASAPGGLRLVRVAHVADGDTIDLSNGARVRLVQIDTPEVYFHPECYGRQASAVTKRLLPVGASVRLLPERATDLVDQYGRAAAVRDPCARWVERQHPPRCRRRRCAVLLRAPARKVRGAARRAGAARTRTQTRLVGPLPRDAVRSVSRG